MAASTNPSLITSSPLTSHTPTSAGTGAKRKRSKYTRRACTLCKMAHAKCGHERPCKRCVSLGRADDCTDAERKKRRRRQKYDGEFFDLRDLIPKIRRLPEWDPNDPTMRPYEEIEQEQLQLSSSIATKQPQKTTTTSTSLTPVNRATQQYHEHAHHHHDDEDDDEDDDDTYAQFDDEDDHDSPYVPHDDDHDAGDCFENEHRTIVSAQNTSTAQKMTTTNSFASFDADMLNLDDMARDVNVSQGVVDADDSFLLNLSDEQLHSESKSWMPADATTGNVNVTSLGVDESQVEAHNATKSPMTAQKLESPPSSNSTTLQVYQPQLHQQMTESTTVDSAQNINRDEDNQRLMQAIEGGNLERFSPELVQQLVYCYLKQRDELNQLRSTIGYLQNMIANFVLSNNVSGTNSPLPSSHVGSGGGFDSSFPRDSDW